MPWTIAHAAAVLPLRRLRALPFPALVAGCISPDLGYYIGRSDWASPAHRLYPGLLLAIPAGLAMLAAWSLLVPFAQAALPTPLAVFFCASCLVVPVLDASMRVEDRLYHYALVAPLWFFGMLCLAGAALRRRARE